MSLRIFTLLVLSIAMGCGGQPSTLTDGRAAWATDTSPNGRAHAGWWAWMEGDLAAASAAWEAVEHPLAALGRARVAADRLDFARALDDAALAARGDGAVGLLGGVLARRAAANLPRGRAQLTTALGEAADRRIRLGEARYTVRVSFLPFLDRARLISAPPVEDDEGGDLARVRALDSWWALSEVAPEPDPNGLVLTRWALPPGPAHVELKLDGPALVWRAGVLVAATPSDRRAPDRLRFTAAGEGPLWVAWAADSLPRGWRLTEPAPTAPTDGADTLASLLLAEVALADGDPVMATRWLADAPHTPAFAAARARLARIEHGVPATLSRDRARASWVSAAPLAPARAHLELARLARRGGDVDAARAHLEQAADIAPNAWLVHRERLRLFSNLGWIEEAKAALKDAERVAPDPCTLVDDRAALRGDRPAGQPDALLVAYDRCERPLDAVDRLLTLHRPAEALARLEARDDDGGARHRRLTARALVGLGRLPEAARLMPDDEIDDALDAADLRLSAAEAPDDLEEALQALIAGFPTAREALAMIAAWPEWSPFAEIRRSTDALISAYEARPELPGPAVRVLDHSAIIYFADGTSLRWVHEVLAIRSREGAEEFGELSLPGDEVHPIAIYTRKADGRRLFAEEIPEKDALSLPDLADGDYVVAVYLEPGDNGYLYDSGYLTPRVYFRGVDMPVFRQQFQVYGPDENTPEYQQLEGGPSPTPVKLGERGGLAFAQDATPVRLSESNPVPPGLWLPSIRAGRGVSLADDLAYYRDRVLSHRRRTPAFDAWAIERAGDGDREARLARLTRAVRAEVDGDAGLIRRSAMLSIHDGRGNRALTLSAALEAVGIGHRLVLCRPPVSVPGGPFAQVADYPYAMISIDDGPWIDPGPDRAGVGWVPFLMLGGDGLVVWPPDAPTTPVSLPASRPITDNRRVEVEAHWGADGVVRGTVIDRLSGQEASVIGRYLAQLDTEQRTAIVERLLLHAFPAGRVITFDDATDADPDGPLVLRYTFEAQAGETLRLGVFPVRPGHRYGHEEARTIPMSIDLPTYQRVAISLTSDREFTVNARPGDVRQGRAGYRLEVDVDDDEIEVDALLMVPGGPVAPDAYPRFAEWARTVDRMERITLTVPTPTAHR